MSELNFYLLQINDALFPIGAYSHSGWGGWGRGYLACLSTFLLILAG